ncbi:TVP38/TMEM64 family protein [Streptococcus dentapri]|uniref:TVP38/TMEM64 family membrane protein n=1 Tax=Streptococcus dentapri TaxID=573564 RepID=A0ABV8CZ41_9STRE
MSTKIKHKQHKHIRKIFQVSSWFGIILTIILAIILYQTGYLTDINKLNKLISGMGLWGGFFFVLIQIIQVVIPIIPGGISTAAGVILFGGFWGFVLNYIGIVIGSLIVFHISKIFGRPLLHSIFKPKLIDKYDHWTHDNKKLTILFAIAIVSPAAPDDFLCYLAGTTDMSYRTYILIILLGKIPAIIAYSFGLTQLFNFFL